MATAKVKANELTETQVTFVSLVDKGANRSPFRVLKSENPKEGSDMKTLNLASIMALMKKSDETVPVSEAQIVALATSRQGQGLVQLKADAKEIGLETKQTVKSEDTVILKFENDNDDEDLHTIQLADDVAVVVKGFQPYISSQEDTTFSEAMAGEGFFMGVYRACSVLEDMLTNNIYDMNSKEDIAKYAESLVNDFKGYVTNLVYQLPQKAFKLAQKADTDANLQSGGSSEIGEGVNVTTPSGQSQMEGKNTQFETETPKDPSITVQSIAEEGEETKKADVSPLEDTNIQDDTEPKPTTGTGTKSPVEYDVNAEVIGLKTEFTNFQSSVTATLQEILSRMDTVTSTVAKSDEKLEDTLSKVTIGAVAGGDTSQDKAEKTVTKSDHLGLIDTGFSR